MDGMPAEPSTQGDKARLVAWGRELRAVHDRMREALEVTRAALDEGPRPSRPPATCCSSATASAPR